MKIPDWLAALYPFEPKSLTTAAGARLSYVDEGPRSTEAVLLLHGNPTWSFYYRRLVSALAPAIRCVAPDHVGMGLSDKPEHYAYTLASRIADVEALVAQLGLQRIHLVVHDWGGAIGFGFATRHPEKIARLTVLNTAAFTSPHIPGRIALCRAPVIGEMIVRGLNGFAGPASWMAMHRRRLTTDEKRGYLLPYGSWADRVAVSAFVKDIPLGFGDVSWPTLAAIEAALPQFAGREALIVWGGRDFCFDDRFLARWREILPAARVHRIADAGHYVLEDAVEETVPLIRDFILRR